MQPRTRLTLLALVVLLAGMGVLAAFFRGAWSGWLGLSSPVAEEGASSPVQVELAQVKISPQARKNLGLVTGRVRIQNHPRTIEVPGTIVDRPGHSDRILTAPAVAVVREVHAFPGDTVRPGERLFTLRLISEYLQNTQAQLFRTSREEQLVREQKDRLDDLARRGSLPEARIIELDNQLKRLQATIEAHRQDLLTRGLTPGQIDAVAEGKLVSEIEVTAPPPHRDRLLVSSLPDEAAPAGEQAPLAYEVQELKVELGQQVQAGQTLCLLANHQALFIEGHAFRHEAPLLEQAARKGWPVEVELPPEGTPWPPLKQTFTVRHLANMVDPASRTLAFFVALDNQARSYEKDGQTFLVWRFRPGQRVRLHVRVAEFSDVIVLPAGAVVWDGPEAYAFRENGDYFDRKPVHVVHEDRRHVVVKADGSLMPGVSVAQNGAAVLLRVLRAQSASLRGGLPPGFHVHPDGSVHGAH